MKVIGCVVLALCYVTVQVRGFCYKSNSCWDKSTNVTHQNGETWRTDDCMSCTCWRESILLKTCLEANVTHGVAAAPQPQDHRKPGQGTEDEGQARVDVFINRDQVGAIECPSISHIAEYDDDLIVKFTLVSYYTVYDGMGCCSLGMKPVGVHANCEVDFDKESCSYHVTETETGAPCPHPYGAVGK